MGFDVPRGAGRSPGGHSPPLPRGRDAAPDHPDGQGGGSARRSPRRAVRAPDHLRAAARRAGAAPRQGGAGALPDDPRAAGCRVDAVVPLRAPLQPDRRHALRARRGRRAAGPAARHLLRLRRARRQLRQLPGPVRRAWPSWRPTRTSTSTRRTTCCSRRCWSWRHSSAERGRSASGGGLAGDLLEHRPGSGDPMGLRSPARPGRGVDETLVTTSGELQQRGSETPVSGGPSGGVRTHSAPGSSMRSGFQGGSHTTSTSTS